VREIKFRAWFKGWDFDDESTPQMVYNVESLYDGHITGLKNHPFGGLNCFGSLLHSEEFVLMQYTGLKDKNGKEIYEGDIVAICGNDPSLVEWRDNDSCFIFNNVMSVGFWSMRKDDEVQYNIVGNIYETPELLK
jgi:hypothetical protein